jgi:F-type H+-transporting ATPase subunit b
MNTLFSFFLTSEFASESSEASEAFFEINSNFFETNIVNILLLLGLLIYAYQISFSKSLENRQKEIIQTVENAQQDVLNATNYYFLAEKGFTQSLFWLQSWKSIYEKDKLEIVHSKYKQVKSGLEETFLTTEHLISNFEKKAFLSLQRYILFLTASRILRKFLLLSESEQSKLIEKTLAKLEEYKK